MLNRPLSLLEARVLAVLVEKELTVPDSYPLSLNYLVSGCNQKSNRNPVLQAQDSDVLMAIDGLKALNLVFETSGGRVMHYEHNFLRVLQVPTQAMALLVTLMLRGAQTLSELRIGSERFHKFADISSVDAFMRELATKEFPLVRELPKQPGSREPRWVHLLSGEPVMPMQLSTSNSEAGSEATVSIDLHELANLKLRVAALEQTIQKLCNELGVSAV